ncbi:MAG: hypothetical protein RIT45_1118 [Pseudomonadota bacterium]|jgi:uncharacterized protein (TIGR00369 family)
MPLMTADAILALMEQEFPEVGRLGLRIDALDDDTLTVEWPSAAGHLRPGGTVSGPAMMTIADTAAYFLVLAHVGPQTLAVTTNLNIHFLRKPAPGGLLAEARLLKHGARLVVSEVRVRSAADGRDVAHATVTYSVPPPR